MARIVCLFIPTNTKTTESAWPGAHLYIGTLDYSNIFLFDITVFQSVFCTNCFNVDSIKALAGNGIGKSLLPFVCYIPSAGKVCKNSLMHKDSHYKNCFTISYNFMRRPAPI